MLQNALVTNFTVSESLRANQQWVKGGEGEGEGSKIEPDNDIKILGQHT